ncbi:hypothetical protein AXF15_07745 [Desulfomicrobium orale DSM 12838]|uniref:Uncharacterized protein n=1 Tax=Desulfomicrobium orale DSM 12838 TaxID=888061 RepID=A0A0X8JQA7_9BACT|nr:hypothetical protein AXF15_07745 [Desulfomicrobium orale DSM 12838]
MKRHVLHISILLLSVIFLPFSAGASSYPYISGHGVNFATGNKYVQETDVRLDGPLVLSFTRTYNSQSTEDSVLGYGWSSPFLSERLVDNNSSITLIQGDGRHVRFQPDGNGTFVSQIGPRQSIMKTGAGYQLLRVNRDIHAYDSQGLLTGIAFANGATVTCAYSGTRSVTERDARGNTVVRTLQNPPLVSVTDSLGRAIHFTYSGGRLASIVTPAGTFSYTYDRQGHLTSVQRPDGKSRRYEYSGQRLTGVIDATGLRVQTLSYDADGRVTASALAGDTDRITIAYPSALTRTITDAMNVTSTYQLDATGGVARVRSFTGPACNACGGSTGASYEYTAAQQISRVTDAEGTVTAYTYDAAGNMLTETEAAGTVLARTTTTAYTAHNQPASISRPSAVQSGGSVTTAMTYDADGNPLTLTRTGIRNGVASSATITMTYTTLGRIASIDGPRTDVNDVTSFAYYPDAAAQGHNRGQLRTVTDALGQVTTYGDYTPLGRPRTITRPDGLVSTLTYDLQGNVLTTTAGNITTSFTYDDAGRLTGMIQPGNRTTRYNYTNGFLISVTDPKGHKISWAHDAKGRVRRQDIHTSAGTQTFTLSQSYDETGNPDALLYPDNATERRYYDKNGNLVRVTEPEGVDTKYTYDALNRLLAVTRAGVASARHRYDLWDNLVAVTDARNHVTSYAYDDFGNVVRETAPDTGNSIFAYDLADNLTRRTDARGQAVTYAYDALNRPARMNWPGGSNVFSYDRGGRLARIQSGADRWNFACNALGQLISETRTMNGVVSRVRYGYSSSTGNPNALIYPSGRILRMLYNSSNQIVGLTLDHQPLISNITYLPFGPVKSFRAGNMAFNRAYDQRYQVTRMNGGSSNRRYTRDKNGRVTGITNVRTPSLAGLNATLDYATENNRLQSVIGANAGTYIYDANGNTLSDGRHAFTYDALNRLTAVSANNTVLATYTYDARNRRTSKTAGGRTIHYHYDQDSRLIGESLANGTVLREYVYLRGEPVALLEYETRPGWYFYVTDHLGTPQQLVDSRGAVVWQAACLPYGETKVLKATVQNNLRFPGQYFDAETGLHYNWNRYYNPKTGRYITADPIGLDGGMNVYAYAGGNPMNAVDPWGLATENWSNCFANCVEKERLDWDIVLSTLGGALGFSTMPKTPAELKKHFGDRASQNKWTGQPSRWAGRIGRIARNLEESNSVRSIMFTARRNIRDFGRSAIGRTLGRSALVGLIFEGYYDWGVIIRCAYVCEQNECIY